MTDHPKFYANELVRNYLDVMIGGAVEEGEQQRDAIMTAAGDSPELWRDIAWYLAGEVAELLEKHEMKTCFETLDRNISAAQSSDDTET
jgi:hypothetical protein